jgi:GTP cyclohydrolase II/3,4-dihydroxy 2-butanone 4-phosphate synthase/GTP cyclohydrolase II
LQLEARAYQGADPNFQALVLVHREKLRATTSLVVRVHSGCVTGDIFHSLRCDCYRSCRRHGPHHSTSRSAC